MQIHVHMDNHIAGNAGLTHHIESVVEIALERFGDRITRVDVHLTDQNGGQKSGDSDKRCVMEARTGGLRPIAVSDEGPTPEQAVHGAVQKLERTLSRTLARLGDPNRRTSNVENKAT